MCVLSLAVLLTLYLFVRLLDVIAGRKDPKGLRSGQVLVDSEIVNADMRMRSAYVVQVRCSAYPGLYL